MRITESPRGLRARRFEGLMPFRVREILLVSSPYDAFVLEEDGLLTEQTFLEMVEVGMPSSPRLTHVATGEEAIRALRDQRFDLVLTLTSLPDMAIDRLARRAKEVAENVPVVLLGLDRTELRELLERVDPRNFDGAFLWSGDATILLTILKYVEDRRNVDHDIEQGNVRVIVMLEDSPRYYSSFLGLLYRELMSQSRALYTEGVDELHRQMYMKSRPKILHATTYEEGVELFRRYRPNVMAVVCDMRLPREGRLDDRAGVDFVRRVLRHDPELPVLLQSAQEEEGAEAAAELGVVFVGKKTPRLLAEIRNFLRFDLRFGDFVFRLPDGREVARARELRDLVDVLERVPGESIVYHGLRNHFSLWLQARSEFDLAEHVRRQQVTDFGSPDEARRYLLEILSSLQRSTYRGIVSDFDRDHFDQSWFTRLGQGPLGGKARGLAFVHRMLTAYGPEDFGGLRLSLPRTTVLATEIFDEFLETNGLRGFASSSQDDAEIVRRFVLAELPEGLIDDLEFLATRIEGPIAVRSSSLLEDSLHQVMAGIYMTLMVPNQSRDPRARVRELAGAVKLVYASAFFGGARAYLENMGQLLEDEKMAVIVQPVVGSARGRRFYPSFSAVAESYNFYPLGPQKPEDGVAHLALGLGRFIVEGGMALRASPRYPGVVPQLDDPALALEATQRSFYAVDLDHRSRDLTTDLPEAVRRYPLSVAESDGALLPVASTYLADDDRIVDDLSLPGTRLVTFGNVLRHGAIPLAAALDRLLAITQEGMGTAVELELAGEMGDWGRPSPGNGSRREPELFVLQVRPFANGTGATEDARLTFATEDRLVVSRRAMGHGVIRELRDLVYVDLETWSPEAHAAIASEVGELNEALGREGRRYLLVGPGRWGSRDEWLGVPVAWPQISNVKVIVEASPAGYAVEPSQGTHFFHNLTSLRLGYMTVDERAGGPGEELLDREWLDARAPHRRTAHLRHLRFEEPLTVVLDGRARRGIVAKPGARPTGA